MNDSQQREDSRSAAIRLTAFGVQCASDGREDEAMAAFERAVAVEPNAADAWCCLGVIYCGRQMIAETISAHRHAALAQPDNAFYWYALGTMYQTFQPRRWRREASAALREALRRQADYPEARAALDVIRDTSAIRRMLRIGSSVVRRARR